NVRSPPDRSSCPIDGIQRAPAREHKDSGTHHDWRGYDLLAEFPRPHWIADLPGASRHSKGVEDAIAVTLEDHPAADGGGWRPWVQVGDHDARPAETTSAGIQGVE